ncbi:MAG: bifunctional UDP-N-acetylglucosamine diphosphorylase/glucosamine-1-phosphate N-acetyltransferase GlmU [Gemmatimonadota bacterium]
MGSERRPLAAVILAAGEGKRMRSSLVKVLHPLAGQVMIRYVLEAVRATGAKRVVGVVGYQHDRVIDAVDGGDVAWALQEEPLGTGHALLSAASALEDFAGDVLVCCGDTPLLTSETLRSVVETHRASEAMATVLAAVFEDPTGYGRIVTDAGDRVQRIVEEIDADAQIRSIRRINTGVYCFRWPEIHGALERLGPDNLQGERYLTDVMRILVLEGLPGRVCDLADPIEVMGINDRVQLARAESVLRERIRRRLMIEGVTFLAPETTLVDAAVAIGPDTLIYPGVVIEGGSSLGRECVIGPFSRIVDAHVGRGVELKGWNHVVRTTVPNGSILEPYVQQGHD